jgi:hypothetical protein
MLINESNDCYFVDTQCAAADSSAHPYDFHLAIFALSVSTDRQTDRQTTQTCTYYIILDSFFLPLPLPLSRSLLYLL